ncbi:hypothetical protein V1512DRAFT_237077 [Lipomyces arxii]|uniref:uncharacterized protein n=1 Tax=Lipomyces arxii TaxID=56418 RepID=UPI0034CD193C
MLQFVWKVLSEGPDSIPYWPYIKVYAPWLIIIYLLKRFFSGASNIWERDMHGRVVIVTGGTAEIGAEVVEDLAKRGAQIILLVKSLSDAWLIETISDLRDRSKNNLIYAEEVDLSSLHSIRLFATRWLDNSPPRRLDMMICCAGVFQPPFKPRQYTKDGVECHWGINYLSYYHLLTLLQPSFRVQPATRDVRIILAGCSSYVLADFDVADPEFRERPYPLAKPWRAFGSSKMALMMFARQFQKKLDNYKRPDMEKINARVYVADPGFTRTATTRNFLTWGSIGGLAIYLLTWPFWWLVLKSPSQAAQTILHVAMSPDCGDGDGGRFFNECKEVTRKSPRKELDDEDLATQLYDQTAKHIETLEKEAAIQRKKDEKKEAKMSKAKTSTKT